MSAVTREQIRTAFFNLVEASADFKASSPRFQHWDNVNETQLPFLTILKGPENRQRQAEGLVTLTLNYHAFVYTSAAMDPEDTPESDMNALLDAIDQGVKPTGADALNGNKQTLGGLVSHCYPFGQSFIDCGEIDGKGLAAIPFQILVPWY